MQDRPNSTVTPSLGDDIMLVILLSLIIAIEFKWVQFLLDKVTTFIA